VSGKVLEDNIKVIEKEINVSNAVYLFLDEVCELALNNNFDIQLAKFDAQFKEADLDEVTSIYDTVVEVEAKYKDDQKVSSSSFAGTASETNEYNFGVTKKLPTGTTLELDFDNQRSWTNSGYSTINPAHESLIKLTLEQELGKNFFGIKDRSNVKITKIDIQNAKYTSLDKIEDMLSEVQKAYWGIVEYINEIKIRENMLQRAKKLYNINQDRFERGIIEEPQLISSEANFEQKKIDLLLAKNEFSFHLNRLKFLLNLEDKDKTILPKDEFSFKSQSLNLSESLRIAFNKRRDYIKTKNEVKSKNINLVMEKNNMWPEINFEASIIRNGLDDHFSQSIEGISSEDNPEYFLGLTVKFPLENRKAKSKFKKAKIEKAKALLELKKKERKILIDIKDSVRNCNILGQRVEKQGKVVELHEMKLKAELNRYKYGRSDTDTVINYQNDLLQSRLLYNRALLDYKKALIELSVSKNSLLDGYWRGEL